MTDSDPPTGLPDLSVLAGSDLPFGANENDTDTGNAHRFARLCGDRVRYLAAEKTWLVWDGKRLARDTKNRAFHITEDVCRDVRDFAYSVPEDDRARWFRWASQSESVGRRDAMLKIASTLPTLAIDPNELDALPHLINAPNGTIDLRDGTIKPHDIADKLTHLTTIDFRPDVVWTPQLIDFRATFQPDADEWNYLMKFLGAMLRGGNPFRLWGIMHGPTTTGKTQLVETVARILGDYAVSVNTSVFRANMDDKPRPDLLRALSARLVYAMEGSDTWELHGDHVKRMTGGDPIVARGMHSGVMVERIPDFTPLIVCNSFPRLKGNADQGVKRRLRVLPFTYSVVGNEDPNKRAEFESDPDTSAALLTQLVVGCVLAYRDGLEDIPARWAKSTLDAFGELNNVVDFLNWITDEGALTDAAEPEQCFAHHFWKCSDLYNRYTTWVSFYGSSDDKRGQLGMRGFGAELRSMGWQTVRSDGSRWFGKINPQTASNPQL